MWQGATCDYLLRGVKPGGRLETGLWGEEGGELVGAVRDHGDALAHAAVHATRGVMLVMGAQLHATRV